MFKNLPETSFLPISHRRVYAHLTARRDRHHGDLAGVLLPALSRAKTKAQGIGCMSNGEWPALSWTLYAGDNNEKITGNLDGGGNANKTNRTGAAGWSVNDSFVPDNTNSRLNMNSQLGKYPGSIGVYKCPADRSLSRGKSGTPGVRSISMNAYLGDRGGPYSGGYKQMRNLGDTNPISLLQDLGVH